ncbi:MAG TPA: iron-containing alcohol dehydrogenase [Bdellovibrionota bacterium]|nr:iron-containing alcohol dehydrogenase [Bdellovibrionota bacterium]
MSTYRFSFPTPIHFGPGVRAKLPDFLKGEKLKRPLIVTDKGLAALPVHGQIVELLSGAGFKVASFSGIWGNPVKSQVTEGVKAFKAHDADCIVGLGGGAALDVAKAIALMATHPGDLFDYEDEKPGGRPINGPIPFWVALPTTSGTGSEVGRSSVVSDDVTHVKKIIFDPKLLARAVFADPELTLELPAGVTAATGMDALTHCVEAYLAKGYHPICDGVALEGLRQAAQYLVRAVRNPKDLEARGGMMMSSMMGAIAFQKGLGVTHSCAHALGTVADLHHGLANGVMIDYALKHNASAVPERFKTMAAMIGLKDQTAEGFLRWLAELKRESGIPARLSGVKVGKEKLEKLVEIAVADSCHGNNPKPCTREDFVRIFSEAF